jgi:hypothetical protein
VRQGVSSFGRQPPVKTRSVVVADITAGKKQEIRRSGAGLSFFLQKEIEKDEPLDLLTSRSKNADYEMQIFLARPNYLSTADL